MAKLKIKEGEEGAMIKYLSRVTAWVEKLNELSTEGIDPLENMSSEQNVFAGDEPALPLSRESALKNAPGHDSEYFRVPSIKRPGSRSKAS